MTNRPAARVLLVDAAGRILLFRGCDPAVPGVSWWFTPGGGLDAGETPAQGAARELFEETGLRVDPAELGEPVWHQVIEFSYDHRWYRQDQEFFLLRVEGWQVDTRGFEEAERQSIEGHHWWSLADLDATDEDVYPEGLADLVRRLLADAAAAQVDAAPQGGL
ncbi:NUDIX hydrolase [Krasilnikovia sp. M28-CT-15]|uniref:NUDIX hydrolase n=1 Tax=Krasilnikovia sp. M28-CT-15 TaxID=3373540 RepID=UPI0038770143